LWLGRRSRSTLWLMIRLAVLEIIRNKWDKTTH
jgi:hypothetical protein